MLEREERRGKERKKEIEKEKNERVRRSDELMKTAASRCKEKCQKQRFDLMSLFEVGR